MIDLRSPRFYMPALALALLLQTTAFSEPVEEKFARMVRGFQPPAQNEGKSAAVRFYQFATPGSFTRDQAVIRGEALVFEKPKLPENAFAVLVGADQTDPSLRETFKQCLITWKLAQTAAGTPTGTTTALILPRDWNNRNPIVHDGPIHDALGGPFPTHQTKFSLALGDEDGSVRIWLPVEAPEDKEKAALPGVCGDLIALYCTLSHPSYGIAAAQTIEYGFRDSWKVPLVRKDSPAYERSVMGRLVDAEGRPIPGAIVSCMHIRTPGEGLITPFSASALTDTDGRFCLYAPDERRQQDYGEFIPANSKYHLRITLPGGNRFKNYIAIRPNGAESTITIPGNETFHTFAFADLRGAITDPEALKGMTLNAQCGDVTVTLGGSFIANGGHIPSGTYTVRASESTMKFDPVQVTPETPEKITFTMQHSGISAYKGRVLDGVTGEPMMGVYVVSWRGFSEGFPEISDAQWNALHGIWPSDTNPPELEPLQLIHGKLRAVARTDAEGRFELKPEDGRELFGVVAVEQGYIGYYHRHEVFTKENDGTSTIPDFRLYPAAKVFVEARAELEHIAIAPRWVISKENNPAWVEGLLQQINRHNSGFDVDPWLQPNTREWFLVPAGANLTVRLEAPYDEEWTAIDIPQPINLQAGDEQDLGIVQFTKSIAVACKVVDATGNPVEGIPVRNFSGGPGSVAHNTGADGKASFHLQPNSSGEFRVTDFDNEELRRNAPATQYRVTGAESEGQTFTLVLTEEQVREALK